MLPQSVSEGIYFSLQRLRGMTLKPLINELRETEQLSPLELDKYRLFKLKEQLRYAVAKIPFYKRWAKSVNFNVSEIKDLDKLKLLPIITKKTLRANIKDFLDEGIPYKACTTSGSTGSSLKFFKDKRSLATIKATGWQVYGWYEIRPGCKSASIWGVSRKPVDLIKTKIENFLFNKITLSAYRQDSHAYEAFYRKLNTIRPDFLYSYTTSFYRFCKFIEESNLSFNWRPKLIVVTGEMLFDWQKLFIKRIFNDSPLADEYGSSEHGIIAFQCPSGRMHIMSQNLIVEVLDADNNPVEEGREGYIVITELNSRSVPFIRYKIGDVGKISTAERCGCGLPYEILDRLKGRIEYVIRCPDGRLVDSSVLGLLAGKVREFRGVQKASNQLEIQVVLDKNKPFDRQSILKELESYFGPKMHVSIKQVSELPIDPSGKFRYFIPLSEQGDL